MKLINIMLYITPKNLKKFLKKNKLVRKIFKRITEVKHKSEWIKIKKGPLVDRYIYLSKNSGLHTMSDGIHDEEQISFIKKKMKLDGKIIFDIGAHIGYISMCFAKLAGEKGKVVSFEPNIYNFNRFKKNLEKNRDLERKMYIYNYAITDKRGLEKFFFDNNVDGGTSSGSFLDKADTAMEKKFYSMFEEQEVKTIGLDDIKHVKPDLIKIDIEGYEGNLIKDSIEYFKKNKPNLIIEVHSILNMFILSRELHNIGYEIEIVKKEEDGRCDIWCQNKK